MKNEPWQLLCLTGCQSKVAVADFQHDMISDTFFTPNPGREKMRSLQGSCKILVKMQLLVRSCKEICSLQDLARKCFP